MKLRTIALSIIWQTLDVASSDMDLGEHQGVTEEEEIAFIAKVINTRAQKAFNEYYDYKERQNDQSSSQPG